MKVGTDTGALRRSRSVGAVATMWGVSGTSSRYEDDAEVMRGCRRGDEIAWKTLVQRYRRLVYSVPVAYRLSPTDAEEVFQLVVVKLFENLQRIEKIESLGAWLVIVARNECRRLHRANRRWRPTEGADTDTMSADPPDVVETLHALQCEHTLALAFERLDRASRELLSALYREEPRPSYTEISRRLGRPVGSLGPTRARCLAKLKRLYLELAGSEGFAPPTRRSLPHATRGMRLRLAVGY